MKQIIVAIDGPAGAGKSTITKIIADKFHLINIDTGAMYRMVALETLRNNLKVTDEKEIIKLLKNIDISFDLDNNAYLNGENVSKEIRSKEVTNIVSPLSNIVEVREYLVEIQRNLAKGKNVIMEGRDITTVVLPHANYKFYLDAKEEERAKRRLKECQEKKINMTYEEILDNIRKRDYNDKNKKVGALKIAEDAIYIDTTNMTIEEVSNFIINKIKED